MVSLRLFNFSFSMFPREEGFLSWTAENGWGARKGPRPHDILLCQRFVQEGWTKRAVPHALRSMCERETI